MKERPIIFSTGMVKAILDGRKTMTRRVVTAKNNVSKRIKTPPSDKAVRFVQSVNPQCWIEQLPLDMTALYPESKPTTMNGHSFRCPHGQIGDRLWVRETWRVESFMDGEPMLFAYKDGQTMEENEYSDTVDYEQWYERVCIQSTEDAELACDKKIVRQDDDGIYHWDIGNSPCRWRPSLFMPRWASRIERIIVLLRVERLLDISEADAKAEGFNSIEEFLVYWDILNKKRGYGVDKNPWNWVIGW